MGSTHSVPATLGLPRTGGVCAFPVYTAQAPGCSIWSGPCVECGSSFRVLHKSTDSVAPAFCVFPGLSASGSQGLGLTLPGCGAPFPSTASGPGSQGLGCPLPGCGAPFHSAESCSGSQRLRRTLPGCRAPFPFSVSGPGSQRLGRTLSGCGVPFPSAAPARAAESGLRKSLGRNRGPVCSVGGGGFSGAEFAPFPSPLPPTSSGDGPALLWSFSVPFANRRQCVRAS